LFRRTETFWIFVSNSTSVIYIGRRSDGRVPYPPPDHKPCTLAVIVKSTNIGQYKNISTIFSVATRFFINFENKRLPYVLPTGQAFDILTLTGQI
jgi:hypothetical protein